MTQVFLGSIVKTSQASYIKRTLEPYISYKNAPRVDEIGWKDEVINFLNEQEKLNKNTLGEGSKKAIIITTKSLVDDLTLSRTVFDALNFFKENRITVRRIHRLENDISNTENLVYAASKKIHNVALTKAVIWLYGCGIARDLVPPNTHVVRFLNQYCDLGLDWNSNKWPPREHLFSRCRNKVGNISNEISPVLNQQASNKQVQSAIWYLQTCKGLITNNYNKGKLSPRKLISFIDSQNWSIKDLETHIVDIELFDDLSEYLNNYLC